MRYERITKSQAKKLWSEGKEIYLCPSNMRVNTPWHIECPVRLTEDLKQDALRYKEHYDNKDKSHYSAQYADIWKGSIERTAWDLMYNNWGYYNTNNEMGLYAHYYIKIE